MSPNRHSISAVSTAKNLTTPLKASVVLLTTVILASCATGGGDNTIPKSSTTIPDGSGSVGGSSGEGGNIDTGANLDAEKALKAAEAKTKAAEDELKAAEAKTKAAEDELKAAEETFGKESAQAVAASKKVIAETKIEAVKAKELAQAARVEAVAKIEAAAKEAEGKIKSAKEAAAKDAVAKVKSAEDKAKAAEAKAKLESEKASKALIEKAEEEQRAKVAIEAKEKAEAAALAAEKAKDKAIKAKEKAEKALKDATDNPGDRNEALKAAEAAKDAALLAKDAAEDAAIEAKALADKAIGDAKVEADKKVADAQKARDEAQARADKAVKDAATAQKRVEEAAAIAKSEADRADLEASQKEQAIKQAEEAKAEALKAKDEAVKANKEAADSKQLAEKAKADLETAETALAKAEKDLEEALASGGNPDALQAEVDRRQVALDAANAKATAAEQAQAAATAAAEAQVAAAQQAAQAAQDALAASQIKNAPEATKSGVQHVSIDASGLGQGALTTTTRDFGITDATQVQARADIASGGLVSDPVALQVSGDNDAAVAGSNGFKSFENTTKVVTSSLGEQDLVYTSTYKDFGDDLRVAHIDGAAAGLLPVNGVAVVGNATEADNMPKDGIVGYTGDATYRKIGLGKDIQFGTSVFTADFVAKNLKGDLTFSDKKIGLEATIAGNQFSGSKDGYNADGGFFGGDAQYLGGVYEGNGAQGTYGAKSDKQTAAEKAAVKAQADADAANAAIAGVQAQAAAAKAAADKAQADAIKAQEALVKAEDNLANAGNGEDLLAAALERAALAEAAAEAAETAEATAIAAKEAALAAKASAEAAATAAKAAADKAIGEAKVEADKKVAEANKQAADAKAQAADAEARADDAEAAEIKAKDEATKAREDAATAIAAANARAETANQQATDAKAQAELEKQKAHDAQLEADQAKSELAKAEADLEAANKALEDALASGGVNTELLEAEVDRRQAALEEANAKVITAQQTQAAAAQAAAAQVTAAQQATKAAQDALTAATIKNAPEAAKSGVQSLNIAVAPIKKVFATTTRDFKVTDNGVEARADLASVTEPGQPGLLPIVPVTISGANDTTLANGFKSHSDSSNIPTNLGILPLTYTSVYKDYSDDMRIGHIDGSAALGDESLPVDGVAVVGNATQEANMPSAGTVGYTGDATYRKLGIGNAIEFGQSVFTADFVAKNVKGDLSFANAGKIGLTAGINGNQFSGSADANAGYLIEGGFYGGDAQYLGGVYEGNGAQGTYGAKSDKQTAAEQAAVKAQADADKANAAIAAAQAQAAAAQEAADKAQADAIKAQEALVKAEENLANAGNGEDLLAAALERAAAAEAAAETAKAAEEAALLAQAAAENAATAAQVAADKARGDAAEQKAAKEKAEVAKAAAEKAKEEALAAKVESDKAKDEALVAKAKAETARDEAIARAKAAEQDALDAANAFSAPDSRISGFQSTSVGKEDGIFENNSNSYDKIKFYTNEVDGKSSIKPIELTLRGADKGDSDSIYSGNTNGFKEYKGSTSFEGRSGITIGNRNLSYSSVYKNFDDQMQIGHIKGDIKQTIVFNEPLSNVYVQGNATNLGDMSKLTNINEGKAKYNGVATYIEGAKGKIAVDGKSKFDVDFVARSLKGKLDFSDKQVDINATISNNTFASEQGAAVSTVGGFYGKGAGLLGGVYEREDSSGYIKGTYGASKVDPTVEVVLDPTESKMTGFQSTALSSKEKTLPFGQGQLDNAIGYVQIRDDNSAWTELKTENGSKVPVDNRQGDNFTSFNKGKVLADMVKPESVLKPIEVSLTGTSGEIKVDAGKGSLNPTYKYNAVYKNFDSQMQVGHVYGNLNSIAGDVSRAANVYVEGYLTTQAGMDNLKQVNDGKAQYKGMATYIENIHLADNTSTAPVNGTSAFNVDFVNGSVDGTLSFTGTDYKYMPSGNKIDIVADITGNTFAGNKNGIDTAGGFYGEEGKFLGGIYQDASVQGGKGDVAGTGTKFQGTFGAEKQ